MILGIVDEVGYIVNRCVVCGKLFKTDNHFDKVCSYECYQNGRERLIGEGTLFNPNSLLVKCEVCDTLQYVNNGLAHCKTYSENCSEIYKKSKVSDIIVYKRVCVVCGVSHITSDVERNTCSDSCDEYSLARSKISFVRICAVCRILFVTKHHESYICSEHCSQRYLSDDKNLVESQELIKLYEMRFA